MGEGSGIIVLESEEHAKARGARIYAYLAGVGLTSDAYHIAAPEPNGRGQSRAMQLALESGGLSTKNVAHINAHATSTVVGDMIEARAIRALLGSHADRTLLSATKSMTGHLLGGAGAVESILVIKAIQDRKAPPTINVTQPDPELEVDLVCDIPRAFPSGDVVGINNSFGFGGHNCALAFTNP
jgi:3-oxoacyl-[acyl-carrier-protein] synthase II